MSLLVLFSPRWSRAAVPVPTLVGPGFEVMGEETYLSAAVDRAWFVTAPDPRVATANPRSYEA